MMNGMDDVMLRLGANKEILERVKQTCGRSLGHGSRGKDQNCG
jgi:hypothetical protein